MKMSNDCFFFYPGRNLKTILHHMMGIKYLRSCIIVNMVSM